MITISKIFHLFEQFGPLLIGSVLEEFLRMDTSVKHVQFNLSKNDSRMVWGRFKSAYCKSLPFFYCLNFEKADCSIFTLLVGWSVGWLVDVTINFFNMQFSAFFLFSNFRKGRLLYIHPVGRLTSPLIFSIYTGIKALY